MSKYRLAALDMDGTLLKYDKSLHPDTLADLRYAAGCGVEIVYCTGRAVPEVTMYREALPFIRYAVCASGAVICDIFEERCIYRKSIDKKTVKIIAAAVEAHGGMLQFLSENISIVRGDQIPKMEDFRAGDLRELFELTAVKADDMLAEAEKYDGFPKINAFFPSFSVRAGLMKEIEGLPVSWDRLGSSALEIKPEGICKAGGLKMLAEHLGIGMEETIAVGDGYNDRGMLMAAGFAAAMGNSQQELLEVCDFVSADNEHNGAGIALRRALDEKRPD